MTELYGRLCAWAQRAYIAFIFATAAACKFRDREHHFFCVWHEIFDRISFFMVEIFYFIIYIVHQLILLHIIHMSQVFFWSVLYSFYVLYVMCDRSVGGGIRTPRLSYVLCAAYNWRWTFVQIQGILNKSSYDYPYKKN